MTEQEFQQALAEANRRIADLEQAYNTYVPAGFKRTILILGLAALLKRPWILLLGLSSHFLPKIGSS